MRTRCLGSLTALAAMVLASAGAAQDASQKMPPLPPPRPDRPAVSEQPDRNEQPGEASKTVQDPAKDVEVAAPDTACIERITRLGLRFEARPAVQEGACSIQTPVLVSALPNGVEVSPASLMNCPVAESLMRWMQDVVQPEAERRLGSAPTKLLIGTSYQCRDQRSGAKLSEHAFGNGVDVMGFEFAKRAGLTVAAHPEGSPEAAFQGEIRKAACPIFNTVLGPGADDDHGDHLHLDLRARKGDYRICQ